MNKVVLIGRLVQDVEVKNIGTKKEPKYVCNFTIACFDGYDEKGENRTQFIDCTSWGNSCKVLEQFTKKGDRIACDGRLVKNIYDDKDGVTRYQTRVHISNIELLGNSTSSEDDEDEEPKKIKKYSRK